MLTLNSLGSIFGVFVLVAGLLLLDLEHKNKQQEAAFLTNATHVALTEFRSNNTLYATRYVKAADALKGINATPASSLRSKELLNTHGTNLADFIAAGAQLREFYIHGPATFTREIENSGESQMAISNILKNFRRRDLKLWNEEYVVLEKTLQMTSNTLILNNLLRSNFRQWHISNAVIVFENADLQKEYLETASRTKQLKSEMEMAVEHLNDLHHQAPLKASASGTGK